MSVSVQEIVFDTQDVTKVATFYSQLLNQPWAMVFEPDWAVVDTQPIRLAFQKVPEGKESPKNRLHLDLHVDDLEKAMTTVLQLGGELISTPEVRDDRTGYVVCRGSDDNEFCLVLDTRGSYEAHVLAALNQGKVAH